MTVLPKNFYTGEDTVQIAQKLLGKILYTNIDGTITSGMIVETEGYRSDDKACHAYNNRRTPRTEVLFAKGGIAYVYLCYGIHYLFNVVTGPVNKAQAVLIRAVEPIQGVEHMQKRRGKKYLDRSLSAGPGALCQALGIDKSLNGCTLNSPTIKILDHATYFPDQVLCSKRVNVGYAKEDANLPWRFRVRSSQWTSLAK